MQISLITPAPKQSLSGNRATAVRWARLLGELGHRVEISEAWDGADSDMLIAVHAWRSAESVRGFRAAHPARPLVVALAGTDIYRFQHSHPEETLRSMELADRLVCLHALVHRDIPERFGAKLKVIYQSAPALARNAGAAAGGFDVCVIGHLRDEKDSLRAAYAVRNLPAGSKIRVVHLGKPHDAGWAADARAEMEINPRYEWRGEVPHEEVQAVMARSRLMVLSSRMEGGANVISESVAAGLPVVASGISGSIGLLGADYRGYYRVEDTGALAELLLRCEREPGFLDGLARQCAALAPLFHAERERESWRELIAGL